MFRKVIVSLLAVLSLSANLKAEWQWATKAGGSGSAESGYAIAIDTDGNQYITGIFGDYTGNKTATFGGTTLTSHGNTDIFVAKLNAAGTFVWAKCFGGTGMDEGAAIAVDAQNNVVVTGGFSNSVDFGSTTLTAGNNDAYSDAFVTKINPADGSVIWAVKGGGAFSDYSTGIVTDYGNNIYITGSIYSDAVFGTISVNATGSDGFVAKINSSGIYQWAKKLGGSDVGPTNILLGDGGLYVTGHFKGAISCVDPAINSVGTEHDVFCVRMDNTGTFYWSTRLGGTDDNFSWSSTTDKDGFCVITGTLATTTNFDSYTLTPSGVADVFVIKLGAGGGTIGAFRFGGNDVTYCNSIKADADNNLYLTGRFFGTCVLGTTQLTATGTSSDLYIAKINSTGIFSIAEKFGGDYGESANSLALNSDKDMFVTGGYTGTISFGTHQLTSNGNDIFTAKFHQTGSDIEQDNSTKAVTLQQNYPNPFNPSTIISFSTADIGQVSLNVFNAKGQMVKELLNTHLPAGNHAVSFHAENLNSGIYFYQLKTANQTITHKMVLQK